MLVFRLNDKIKKTIAFHQMYWDFCHLWLREDINGIVQPKNMEEILWKSIAAINFLVSTFFKISSTTQQKKETQTAWEWVSDDSIFIFG